MTRAGDLPRRICRLEDRAEIGELVARYCLGLDDRDLARMTELFTPDAVVRSSDRVMHAAGLRAVVAMFRGRFAVLGPSNRFTHDRNVQFEDDDPDAASGIVLAHAEMNRRGQMLAAIRYADRYRRLEGRWRIAERVIVLLLRPDRRVLGRTRAGACRPDARLTTRRARPTGPRVDGWRADHGP